MQILQQRLHWAIQAGDAAGIITGGVRNSYCRGRESQRFDSCRRQALLLLQGAQCCGWAATVHDTLQQIPAAPGEDSTGACCKSTRPLLAAHGLAVHSQAQPAASPQAGGGNFRTSRTVGTSSHTHLHISSVVQLAGESQGPLVCTVCCSSPLGPPPGCPTGLQQVCCPPVGCLLRLAVVMEVPCTTIDKSNRSSGLLQGCAKP